MKRYLIAIFLVLALAAGIFFAKISNAPLRLNPAVESLKTPAVLSEAAVSSTPAPEVISGFAKTESTEVKRVIDGDTVELANGEHLRYIGMDTPEIVAPGKPIECFGREAAAKNKELVEGKTVRLEKDVSERDKYGRLLRYVWVNDVFVNLELVKAGYAIASTYPPDVRYSAEFVAAEKQAREEKLGLWNLCK
jgi:micrococcal nuclease